MTNREQRSISLLNKANGALNHLNYPQPLPSNVDFTQHIIVPLGEVILLEIYNVGISDSDCHSANRIEVRIAIAIALTFQVTFENVFLFLFSPFLFPARAILDL